MKTITKKEKSKKADFSLLAPHAANVFIAGDFNDWNTLSHPMKKDRNGVWKTSLSVIPGTYQYRFLVDGEWQNDPDSTECVGNPFGGLNCVRKVK
jgi:1,4-alpha-glucan branching enzyme